MATDVYVIGVGMTRFGNYARASVRDLAMTATVKSLEDAALRRSDIEGVYFANAMQGHMEGQHCIRGQVALRGCGFARIPIINVDGACASAAIAFSEAVKFVRAGEGSVALALGAEKLSSADRALTFSAFEGAWDVSAREENARRLESLGSGVEEPAGTRSVKPYSRFLDVYAAFGRYHMRAFGLTQRQLAAIASKNHGNAVHNPYAQFREHYTVDDVLSAPPVVYPLTRPMCSPISDGAAAAIVCSEDALQRLGDSARRAIRIRASVVGTGVDRNPEEYEEKHIARLTARRAYERAGIEPADVSLAEVHDATAVGEALATECLGFAAVGEGGAMAERGVTAIGGKLPVNPSGGLEAKGHPVGATGLGQVWELVAQLRGECGPRQVPGARIGLAENGGGFWGYEEATCVVTILEGR